MAYQSEIEKLEQRYRENPDQWFAALADSYRKAGNLDLALDVVQAGLQKRPNYVSGHIVLGRCLLQKPDDAAATAAFEKVLGLDAENVIALKALSEIAERATRVDDARRWLTRLLEVDPMNEEAEQALARLKEAPAAPATPAAPAAPAGGPAEGAEGAGGAAAAPGAGAPGAGEGLPAAAAAVAETPAEAPAQGVEPTVTEMPAVREPGAAAATTSPLATTSGEFVLEKSEEAAVPQIALGQESPPVPVAPPAAAAAAAGEAEQPAPTGSAAPSGLEPVDFEATAGADVPHAEGVENLAFEPPPPGETPAEPDLEPMEFTAPPRGAAEAGTAPEPPVAAPFDDQLAWGTGQRLSGQITQEDLAAAERAHEASLEPVAEVAGLGAPEGDDSESEAGSSDLPLIFPDEPPARVDDLGRDGEPPAGAEAAPVLTETMAELYVEQGLLAEAREIYRTLVAQRPGDAALASRLAALETTPGAVPRRTSRPRVTAVETGGPSVRDFLGQVFGGALPPPPPRAPSAQPSTPPESKVPAGGTASREPAFAGSGGETGGAPTRRASDEVSLAAVFGEEPVPPRRAQAAESPKEGGESFSFDEFFGGQARQVDGSPSTRAAAGRTDEDEDDFKRWLKGLKS